MIDLEDICDGLAARFAAATIGTPSGAPAMRYVYAETPNNVAATPAVILEVDSGEIVANPGQWKHEIVINVIFLLARQQGDTRRVEEARRRWLPYLLNATQGQLKIGLGGASGYSVDKAIPAGTWEFTEYDVAGDTYDAIRIPFTVYVTETVTLVA